MIKKIELLSKNMFVDNEYLDLYVELINMNLQKKRALQNTEASHYS